MNTQELSEIISQSIIAAERAAWFGNIVLLAMVALFAFVLWRGAQRRKEEAVAVENAALAEELRELVQRIDRRIEALERTVAALPRDGGEGTDAALPREGSEGTDKKTEAGRIE